MMRQDEEEEGEEEGYYHYYFDCDWTHALLISILDHYTTEADLFPDYQNMT